MFLSSSTIVLKYQIHTPATFNKVQSGEISNCKNNHQGIKKTSKERPIHQQGKNAIDARNQYNLDQHHNPISQ
jgi:hypothetical protein